MIRRVEFYSQDTADAWVLQNKLRRTHLPTSRRGSFYLTTSSGEIVGQWQQISKLDQVTNGCSVVEICWYDQRKVKPPREYVN